MKKVKKLWQNRIFRNYFLLIISFLILEILFHLINQIPIFYISTIRVIIGLNIIALFLGYLFSYLPKIVNNILNIILVLIASIYGLAELGFYNFLGVYASIGTNTQLGAVNSYLNEFISSFKWYFYLMIIPFFLILIYYIFIEKKITLDLPKRKLSKIVVLKKIIPLIIIIILSLLYYSTLKIPFMQDKIQSPTNYELFKKPTNASLIIRNFGYISYGLLDIKEYVFPGKSVRVIEFNQESLNSEINSDTLNALIDNEKWLGIINEETNIELNTLNNYFISNQITTTNSYTGFFEDKNVIFIMVESGNDIMLNEKYYPNINKLVKNGLNFTNNYSPRNICSTGNNEMSTMISLYSINNNCTANVYQDNEYFESIFNLFNNANYETNSFHDYYDWYYNRNIIHKNMGSQAFYDAIKLGLDFNYKYNSYNTWGNDEELMEAYLEVMDKNGYDKPFMSYITTVSSHQPYKIASEFGDMYMDLFPADYSKDLKSYMSKLKVVDNAIGILLDGLETRGILDDTVIVLFADHYPYAIDTDKLNAELDYDASVDNNADKVPFIIYNSEIEKKKFTNYTSYVDILPTIANLFGLKYDSRLYLGSDALSNEAESLVIFIDGSWKNEKAFYNASTNEIHYYTKDTYSDKEILEINTKVRLKLEMSSLAIKNNYFSYLNKKLNNNTTSD